MFNTILLFALLFMTLCGLVKAQETRISELKLDVQACNAAAFSQMPGQNNLFVGRVLSPGDPRECNSRKWSLALFSFDFASRRFIVDHEILSIPFLIGDKLVVSAYDPYVVTHMNKTWIAFECAGPEIYVSICIAPMNITRMQIDLSRASIPIRGVKNLPAGYRRSASVPKLLSDRDALYLYWSVVDVAVDSDSANIYSRGVQVFTVNNSISTAPASEEYVNTDDPQTAVVFQTNKKYGTLESTVAEIYDVRKHNYRYEFLVATGGIDARTGKACRGPGDKIAGCYQLHRAVATSAIGSLTIERGGDKTIDSLATYGQEYARFVNLEGAGEGILLKVVRPVHQLTFIKR